MTRIFAEATPSKDVRCPICDKAFSAMISLTYHLKNNVCTREPKPKEPKGEVPLLHHGHLFKCYFQTL